MNTYSLSCRYGLSNRSVLCERDEVQVSFGPVRRFDVHVQVGIFGQDAVLGQSLQGEYGVLSIR